MERDFFNLNPTFLVWLLLKMPKDPKRSRFLFFVFCFLFFVFCSVFFVFLFSANKLFSSSLSPLLSPLPLLNLSLQTNTTQEVVWTPNNHKDNHGGNTKTGFQVQTKAKPMKMAAGKPPAKKSLADLP